MLRVSNCIRDRVRPGASEGVPPSRTSDQESPEEEKVVVARRNDQQVSGDTHARERGRNYSPIPQGRAFLSGRGLSLFRPPFFKYYARRGASMIAPSLPIASTGQPSIASWQSASSSGVSGCL